MATSFSNPSGLHGGKNNANWRSQMPQRKVWLRIFPKNTSWIKNHSLSKMWLDRPPRRGVSVQSANHCGLDKIQPYYITNRRWALSLTFFKFTNYNTHIILNITKRIINRFIQNQICNLFRVCRFDILQQIFYPQFFIFVLNIRI